MKETRKHTKHVPRSGGIFDDRTTVLIVLGSLAALTVFALKGTTYDQFVAANAFVFALLGLSLGLAWGHGGLWILGQAGFFGIGAYAYAIAGEQGIGSPWVQLLIAVTVSMCVAALIAVTLMRRLHGLYLALATMILVFVAQDAASSWTAFTGGSNGLASIEPLSLHIGHVGFTMFDPVTAVVVCAGVLLAIYLALLVWISSRFGAVVAAAREDAELATVLGYRVDVYRGLTLIVSGGIAGVAGVLYAIVQQGVFPDAVGFTRSAEAVVWLLIGGTHFLAGPLVGALLLTIVQDRLSSSLQEQWLLVQGIAIMVAALWLRNGLLGVVQSARSLTLWRNHRPRRRGGALARGDRETVA